VITIPIEDHADAIEKWISEGKTLRSYCRKPGAPSRELVDKWRRTNPEFGARIARARDIGYDAIAEEALAIADDASNDDDGEGNLDHEFVARSKLRVETRLKLLAKWDPRRYGDKLAVGGDADAPPIRLLSVTERMHRIQAIVGAAARRALPEPDPDDLKEIGL
jgi:hypothetical protein